MEVWINKFYAQIINSNKPRSSPKLNASHPKILISITLEGPSITHYSQAINLEITPHLLIPNYIR